VQVLAELADDMQAGLAVKPQKIHQVAPLDPGNLGILQQLRADLVRASSQARSQAQGFAGPRTAQGHTPPVFRAHENPCVALAQYEHVARGLSLSK
jgi:hypothetical protein